MREHLGGKGQNQKHSWCTSTFWRLAWSRGHWDRGRNKSRDQTSRCPPGWSRLWGLEHLVKSTVGYGTWQVLTQKRALEDLWRPGTSSEVILVSKVGCLHSAWPNKKVMWKQLKYDFNLFHHICKTTVDDHCSFFNYRCSFWVFLLWCFFKLLCRESWHPISIPLKQQQNTEWRKKINKSTRGKL